MRLDKHLVQLGSASSRTLAAKLVADGRVAVNGKTIRKAAHEVGAEDEITVSPSVDHEYVSR